MHCKFNAVYDFVFKRAVYELEPAKVTPATWNPKNVFHDNSKSFALRGLKLWQSSSEPKSTPWTNFHKNLRYEGVRWWTDLSWNAPQVKIEVSRGQSSKIFQNGFWTIKSLILKVDQRFWCHRVCLIKARRTMYNLTLKGQGQNLTSGQVRARSPGDPSRSNYTSFDAPCGDKRNDSNQTSLFHLVLKLLAKNCWWPRVTSMTFRGVTD